MEPKVWTRQEIKELLLANDKAVARGLMAIYNRQTENEQYGDQTVESNGVGFNKYDAAVMSSVAKWYASHGYLTGRQTKMVRAKILKYSGQLTDIANA